MALHLGEEQQQSVPAAKDRRRKRGAVLGVALISVAIVAALAAAVLLTRYMDMRTAAARIPTAKVVVARVDIPVASPLKAEWLQAVDWPAATRPEGAAADPAPLLGRVATARIFRGEAVLPGKLAEAGARSGLSTLLEEGMRAAAVRVDDVVGVAGFIHPGDRVDVIVTMKPRDEAPFVGKVILQHVKVLAVGKDLEAGREPGGKPVPVTVATLMVSTEESEALALAASKGKLLLTLRGLGDEEIVASSGVTPAVLLAAAIPPPPTQAAAPRRSAPRVAAAPLPPPPTPRREVEILRGDMFEKRDFAPEKRP